MSLKFLKVIDLKNNFTNEINFNYHKFARHTWVVFNVLLCLTGLVVEVMVM